jgi:hypothetical protein
MITLNSCLSLLFAFLIKILKRFSLRLRYRERKEVCGKLLVCKKDENFLGFARLSSNFPFTGDYILAPKIIILKN